MPHAGIGENVRVRHLARLLVPVALATSFTVACSSDDASNTSEARIIDVVAVEYDFLTTAPPDIVVGETITFTLTNEGDMIHELQLLDEQGRQLGIIAAIAPGDSGELTHRFERAGLHQVICDIEDHLTQGQRKVFEVTQP